MIRHWTFLAAALAASVLPAVAQEAASLSVASSDEYGEYLAGSSGMTLYMFEADTQGEEATDAVSACYDSCATFWPPLTTTGDPEVGDGISVDLIGTIERTDGTTQVTYNGWPLYYYARDEVAGDTTGQGVDAAGGLWYLVSPGGEVIED